MLPQDAVVAVSRSNWEGVVSEFCNGTVVTRQGGDKSKAGWVPWTKYIGEHGEAQVRAMIEAGTVTHTVNPMLQNTAIGFPMNALFWRDERTIVHHNFKAETARLTRQQSVEDDFAQLIGDTMAGAHSDHLLDPPPAASSQASGQAIGGATPVLGVAPGGNGGRNERKDSAIVTQIKKVHGAYDRQRREYALLLSKAGASNLTRGTPMEALLRESVEKAGVQDAIILDAELKLAQGDTTIEHNASTALASCLGYLKAANKYGSALRQLLKLDVDVA